MYFIVLHYVIHCENMDTMYKKIILVVLLLGVVQNERNQDSDLLLVTDQQTRKIIRIDASTGDHVPLAVLHTGTPWGIAYDPEHDIVYWADRGKKWIALSGVNKAWPPPTIYKRLCQGMCTSICFYSITSVTIFTLLTT